MWFIPEPQWSKANMSFKYVGMLIISSALLISACSTQNGSVLPTSGTSSKADSHAKLEREARVALNKLYQSEPNARSLGSRANAIMVFPDMLKAGLLVGGAGGDGVLFSRDGQVLGYYNSSSLSYGLQAGAQSFSEALFIMTPAAQTYLDSSDGWSIGSGPSVVVAKAGVAEDYSSTTLRSDVYAMIFAQEGLMAGIGVQGQKITKLSP
jgi:lipid-binding SYLF domain-containing protein